MKTKAIYIFTFLVLLLSVVVICNVVYNAWVHEGDHGDHYGNYELAVKDNCWLANYKPVK
jgi:hypothetical protein